MLTALHIENIAVIESADISFVEGFHVLTGETGAGKSIVIDAISAILGERAYRDMIRSGCKKGFVSALFTGIRELEWFENNGIPFDENELLIQREIFIDGKNTCRVNGRPVTVSILKQLGGQLITIHGQHDSQQLFDETTHLTVLDVFSSNDRVRCEYLKAFEEVERLRKEIDRLSVDESEKLRKTEMLQHQIKEIDHANLQIGEDEELESKRKLLQNAEKIADGLQNVYEALNGGEDHDGAVTLLTEAERELQHVGRFFDGTEAMYKRVENLMYEASDVAEEIRNLLDSIDFSEGELERVEDRLDIIKRLKRKYGTDISEILEYRNAAAAQLDDMIFSDEKINKLKSELKLALREAKMKAELLSESRMDSARTLENRIQEELRQLDMPKVRFATCFEKQEMTRDGIDRICFMMSANIGEDLKPLSKVASGGELARIMLAIKNVMAEKDSIPTLIFDEVDAGVSGRAAQKVAEKLKKVSSCKQVLCVSHLPQIAAMADVHLLIAKGVKDDRTYTTVTPLNRAGRIEEIARIIGGSTITETTRRSAEEMLPKIV